MRKGEERVKQIPPAETVLKRYAEMVFIRRKNKR